MSQKETTQHEADRLAEILAEELWRGGFDRVETWALRTFAEYREQSGGESELMKVFSRVVERLPEIKSRLAELERVKAELERIVCTEGEDAGVFFLSPDSRTKYDPELGCHVFENEFFSELGEALVKLWASIK